MTKIVTRYIRKQHVILNAGDKSVYQDCKTINKAKRLSRELQGKQLGQGLLRVDRSADPKPATLDFGPLRTRTYARHGSGSGSGSARRKSLRNPSAIAPQEPLALPDRLRVRIAR